MPRSNPEKLKRQVPVHGVLEHAKRVTMTRERGTSPVMFAIVSVNVRLEYNTMSNRLRCSYRERISGAEQPPMPTVKMQFHTCFYRPVMTLPRRKPKVKRCATALMAELMVKGSYRLAHYMQRVASKKEVATCTQRYDELETTQH